MRNIPDCLVPRLIMTSYAGREDLSLPIEFAGGFQSSCKTVLDKDMEQIWGSSPHIGMYCIHKSKASFTLWMIFQEDPQDGTCARMHACANACTNAHTHPLALGHNPL